MTTITREQLHERARRKVKELEFAIMQSAFTSIRDGLNDELELARIALAALEAAPEPVVPESISVRQAISALESADCVTTIGQAYKMGWNACRAAMLQGSQPVSNHDELPYAQVKAVADLYALCWQSGEVVTYTPDPEKSTIWLNNYSGTSVQEYVNLERLQEDTKHGLLEVAIARFSKMNEGFPIKRFKADWVISWMLENFPPVAQKQGDN